MYKLANKSLKGVFSLIIYHFDRYLFIILIIINA